MDTMGKIQVSSFPVARTTKRKSENVSRAFIFFHRMIQIRVNASSILTRRTAIIYAMIGNLKTKDYGRRNRISTIPLSKYNQMLQELANLKIFREQGKEEIKKNAEKPYENLIGPNKDYVGYLAREFGNISSMVEYYQGRICALEHNLEESKNEVRNLNNKLKFSIERENRLLNKYNLIINERSTKWYQIIKRIKIRKEMKKLQKEE